MLELTGATYRQLDYWSRDGRILRPFASGRGTGRPREWPAEDVEVARCITVLTRAGFALDVAARVARERDEDGRARVQLSEHVRVVVEPEAWHAVP
jgi:DNA-binding transcriptional MerR regulator